MKQAGNTRLRSCGLCRGTRTYIDRKGVENWFNYKDLIICKTCFEKTPERRKYMQKIHALPKNRTPYRKPTEKKKQIDREYGKRNRASERMLVIWYYSNGTNKCKCCGENMFEFLTIEHPNQDGAKHRRKIGRSGGGFYKWLIENRYPNGFEVLCMNCNWGKYVGKGKCPHEK